MTKTTLSVVMAAWTACGAVVQEKGATQARLFELGDIRLLDGPFKDARETERAFLLRLDPDRFLHTFRMNVGLPSEAQPYGGWEAPGCELRGHSLGHYLSACSLMYAATGDTELKRRADYIVDELARCQVAGSAKGFNAGYLSAFPESFFDRVEACQRVWAPYYTLHKIFAGLLDANRHCGNARALEVACRFADWVGTRLDKLDRDAVQKMLGNEHGGMAESLAELYARTGVPRYLELAKAFRHDWIFNPMLENRDTLTGIHGNTQIPKFTGYQRIYELTGETEWARAARNFWTFVARDRSFVIGGDTTHEHFFPVDRFAEQMQTVIGPETCNTYNMLKLSKHLFREQPDAGVADFYERALYNHILASQRPGRGGFVYYTSLCPGTYRGYSRDETDFWCCVGTGMENYSRSGEFIYANGDETLYVNLFIASELTWKEKGLVVRLETRFPEDDTVRLRFVCAQPVMLTVKVRQPAWTGKPSGYADYTREWHDGDTLDLRFPMTLHEEFLPHSREFVALLYGPIVLAGRLGNEGLDDARFLALRIPAGECPPLSRTLSWVTDTPESVITNVAPIPGKPLAFVARNLSGPSEAELIPFYRLHGERYNVYWRCVAPAVADRERQERRARERREQALAARIVDRVTPAEEASEAAHALRGERTNAGTHLGRGWRHATDGGWFSYELKTLTDQPAELLCTYWGSDVGHRVFDVIVEGQPVATQTLNRNKPDEFFDVTCKIPPNLTRGKQKVTVRFQAHPGAIAGGVFDVRTLRAE